MSGLQRKTPLRSNSRLNPGKGLSRGGSSLKRTPIKSGSKSGLTAKRPVVSAEEKQGRAVVAERSGGVCEICGQRAATDMAHRRPRSGMGGWEAYNILHACRECHRGNHDDPQRAIELGQHVSRFADPEGIPVLYRGRWVLLTEGVELVETEPPVL